VAQGAEYRVEAWCQYTNSTLAAVALLVVRVVTFRSVSGALNMLVIDTTSVVPA
jgi:hypothetical protein